MYRNIIKPFYNYLSTYGKRLKKLTIKFTLSYKVDRYDITKYEEVLKSMKLLIESVINATSKYGDYF